MEIEGRCEAATLSSYTGRNCFSVLLHSWLFLLWADSGKNYFQRAPVILWLMTRLGSAFSPVSATRKTWVVKLFWALPRHHAGI